jgi:pimeloyl-ACP methyl ester carboxylesterase
MRILLLALSLIATAGCARLIGGEAGVVLQSIVHGPAETELGRSTPAPRRERLAEADLWLPGTGTPTASVVLAPGMAEAGRDDPRLLPVAESLARAGFAVRVADQPGAQRLTLDPADIEALRRAARAEAQAGRRVSLVGISFGAAPALIAAQDEPVELVLTLGGFHSMDALAVFAATGAHRLPGETEWRLEAPSRFAAGGFLLAVADTMPDGGDRWMLRAAGRRLLDDPAAGLDGVAERLTPTGRSALDLAAERDPDRIPARLAALPEPVRATLAAMDPSRRVLTVCTLAIHGEADPVIPWTQSAALARAMPPGRAVLVVAPGFGHSDPAGLPIDGQLALVRGMRTLLAWRDGRDPCA